MAFQPLDLLALVMLPLFMVGIDGTAAVRARNRTYVFGDIHNEDFTVMVPIWGKMAYLVIIDYLKAYGNRVLLCTTGDESDEFYKEFHKVAKANGFSTFVDKAIPKQGSRHARTHTRRTTGGTTRDRLIRNALAKVTTTYVVPLDADSTSVKPMSLLVGELVRRGLDIASIMLVIANRDASFLTKLQDVEYRLAMRMRFVAPWMVSGAGHVARTEVLRKIMNRHSLFFQGNDVEIGVLAQALGYKIGYIPFEILTEVPDKFGPWMRQRLAWAGGEIRLFIVNPQVALRHPFFWVYGGLVTIIGVGFRWWALFTPGWGILSALALYFALVLYLHWRHGHRGWALMMPIYKLGSSMILTPFGLIWYFKMAITGNNWGLIRVNRGA